MNKIAKYSLIAVCILILAIPGEKKKWWSGCYKSEEEARIDRLECDLGNLVDKLKEKNILPSNYYY